MAISIITTTYRHQDFIAQTIESILAQTYTNRELFIGDDSPDDATREIIQSYASKYPEKIKARHHKPNKGIVDNMNFLLSQTSLESDYIAFLEGDDLFTPDNLKKKIDIIKKYPSIGLIYNNLDFIDAHGKIFYTNFLRKAPFFLKNQTLTKKQFIGNETFYGSYSTLLIKKSILIKETIKNPTKDKVYGVSDWDLFFRIVIMYPCYGIEESLTLYRRHSGNVSGQYLKLFDDLEIQLHEYLLTGFLTKSLFKRKLSFVYLLRSVAYLEKDKRKKTLSCLYKAYIFSWSTDIIYKIGINLLIMFPKSVIKLILKRILKRG